MNRAFNAARRLDRDISEMLGLAKGMLADGVVSPSEAVLLNDWARLHPETVSCWPGNVLLSRLDRVFADGVVTQEEQSDLAELLRQLTGGEAGVLAGDTAATTLPIDVPPPELLFPGRTFVFTGKFAFGPRRVCENAVTTLGARAGSSITRDTHYLVIGTFGSRDWIHTSHGRKIEEAVALRSDGGAIAILSEDHWAAALP
jgi:NAD-dependent DNA ligase